MDTQIDPTVLRLENQIQDLDESLQKIDAVRMLLKKELEIVQSTCDHQWGRPRTEHVYIDFGDFKPYDLKYRICKKCHFAMVIENGQHKGN